MNQKSKTPPAGGPASTSDQREYRNIPQVDAKIDAYIKDNPAIWADIQAMPRERLERSIILGKVTKLEREQRIQESVMKEVERNPELKQAYETVLQNVPEDLRDQVMAQVAAQTKRAIGRSQRQGQSV